MTERGNEQEMSGRGGLTCEEVAELAGLYVLHALDVDEAEAVREHLDSCVQAHPELAAVGGVVPALALLFEPVDAPVDLKSRVMAAVSSTAHSASTPTHGASAVAPARLPARTQAEADARVWEPPAADRPQPRRMSALSWGMAATAVMLIAVLGAWNVVLQSRAGEVEQRAQTIAQAIAASAEPDADVAVLRGTGPAEGASGFAAFPVEGEGYIVLVDLPPAPAGQTYQAWYLVDGRASSAGLLTVGSDGYAVLSGVDVRPDAQQIALTIEPAGGVEAPSAAPVVAGELSA